MNSRFPFGRGGSEFWFRLPRSALPGRALPGDAAMVEVDLYTRDDPPGGGC